MSFLSTAGCSSSGEKGLPFFVFEFNSCLMVLLIKCVDVYIEITLMVKNKLGNNLDIMD